MIQLTQVNRPDSSSETCYDKQIKQPDSVLGQERIKLEAMVLERLKQRDSNMGTDWKILMQSNRVDKMVVREMLFDEMVSVYGAGED